MTRTEVDLTTEVQGVLPVANGGIGQGSLTGLNLPTPTLTDPVLVANPSPTYAAGKLVFDSVNDCLTFFSADSNVSNQLGQEIWLRCRNVTGSAIANGTPVYASGADSSTGLVTVAPALATAANTAQVVGLTTETIANNATGYVTVFGVVHGLNTSAFTAGVPVYVDPATPGALNATPPTSPNYRTLVGYVSVSNATTGSIYVTPTGTVYPVDTPATRTGVFPWEPPNSVNTGAANQPINFRRLASIPVNATRFRFHFRNYNQLGDAYATGTIANLSVYIGDAARDSNGNFTGAFVATPVQIINNVSVASGTEAVSAWIPTSTFAITAYRDLLVSVGLLLGSTGQVAQGGGLMWYVFDNTQAGVVSPTLSRQDNAGYTSMYLEFEYVDATCVNTIIVGNSTSGGGNPNNVPNLGELDSWGQIWALSKRGIAATIAASGSSAAQYNASSPKWSYYSGLATPLVVDAVVMWNHVTNDVASGSSLAVCQASLITSTLKAKSLWPNARIIHTTMQPRLGLTVAMETVRLAINQWIPQVLPGGADECWDIDPLVANPLQIVDTGTGGTVVTIQDVNYPAQLHVNYDCGDGVHCQPRGNARLASIALIPRIT